MAYIDAFRTHRDLIEKLGDSNAHLVWTLAMLLQEPDLDAFASAALTDGSDDKKIDLLHIDRGEAKIIFAQGYLSKSTKDSAPANKASDLNTAAAWLLSGDLSSVLVTLRSAIEEARTAINDGDINSIDLYYVHNLPESVNVRESFKLRLNSFVLNLEVALR